MNETYYESNSGLARVSHAAASKRVKRVPGWVKPMTVVMVWLLVATCCFALAKFYVGDIQSQLDTIAKTNELEVKQLNEKLAGLQSALDAHKVSAEALNAQFTAVEGELAAVKEEMSLAGNSLSTTAETKQALSERINDLSTELGELRKLIKKLEEAARVY